LSAAGSSQAQRALSSHACCPQSITHPSWSSKPQPPVPKAERVRQVRADCETTKLTHASSNSSTKCAAAQWLCTGAPHARCACLHDCARCQPRPACIWFYAAGDVVQAAPASALPYARGSMPPTWSLTCTRDFCTPGA
jgi:hypothetical protein